METENIISIVISAISLIFTVFTTIRCQKLDMSLKKYELEKNMQAEEDSRKADIEVNVVRGIRGNNKLQFYNRGMAYAENINFEIPTDIEDKIKLRIRNDYLPYPKLLPQQNFEIHYYDFSYMPHQTIVITWDDAFGKRREKSMVVDL